MTGGSSGLSSKSLDTSAGSTSWDCLRLVESLNIEPRRPGFLCFGVSGMTGLEDEELGVGLPVGSTIDLERSRLALERNLGSLGPWLEPVGDDGEGDVRDGLADIVVVVDGKRRVVCGRCRRGAIDSDSGAYPIRPPPTQPSPGSPSSSSSATSAPRPLTFVSSGARNSGGHTRLRFAMCGSVCRVSS